MRLLIYIADGQYSDAAYGYEKAQDYDNLVRILIDHLKDIQAAVSVVRKTHSRDSAKLVVKFFQERREYKPVIEFCLLAGMDDDAFEIARASHIRNINPSYTLAIRMHGILCRAGEGRCQLRITFEYFQLL